MKFLVSACLLGENCKYNGKNNFNQKIADFCSSGNHEIIPICPEVLGGLPIPRTPSEIVNGTVINKNGENVDFQFRLGAQKALEIVKNGKIDFAILKANSPSCGNEQIYDGTFSGKLIAGQGIFVQLLNSLGIKVYNENQIEQFFSDFKITL